MAPEIDWGKVDDQGDFTPIPEGSYKVAVIEVDPDNTTQDGDELWKFRLEVQEGPHKGRLLFDNLSFGPKALKRAKLIFSRLGVNTVGKMNMTPDMILDKECFVDVEIGSYTDDDGNAKRKNVIPFAGYHPLTEGPASQPAAGEQQKLSGGKKAPEPKGNPDDDLPF